MHWKPLLLLLLLFGACEPKAKVEYALPYIPAAFPIPDSIRHMSLQAREQALLGKKLFFDKRLSRSETVSCASCHMPKLAFSGGVDRNIGENNGRARRNTPALFNLWTYTSFFHDGGIPRLSEVALAPMDNSHELNLPIDTLVRKLWTLPDYRLSFDRVFGQQADPLTVTRALMWYQLSLVSANSKFDHWYFGKQDVLTPAEKRGYELFISSKTQCNSCHSIPLFTDGQFHHIGYTNSTEPDTGRARISMKVADEGKFRTPSLRNLAYTAPYFHDGALGTIDEVLLHYNKGGDNHPNKDSRITALGLSLQDLSDLKAFLLTLSDTVFVNQQAYGLPGYQD